MPLVRISLVKGQPAALRRSIGDAVHRAMVEAIDVPQRDRFQLLTEHEPGDLVYDSEYLGIARSDNIVIIQITLSAGRSLEKKRRLYRRRLDAAGEKRIRRRGLAEIQLAVGGERCGHEPRRHQRGRGFHHRPGQ